jgi:molecular chaperone HscB
MNYFELYKLPVAFNIDLAAARRVFLENSKKFHPDFHTLADAATQQQVLEQSALNNEAWKTLSDADRRMQYILQLKGILAEEGANTIPQDFLMDIMDINEALMDLEMDFDQVRFEQTLQAVQLLENELHTAIQPVLDTWTDGPNTAPDLEGVKNFYLKKRYLLRIRENLSTFAAQSEN